MKYLIFCLFLLSSCQYFQTNEGELSDDVVAIVNQSKITVDEYQEELQFYQNYIYNLRTIKESNPALFQRNLLNEMINNRLITQAAEASNIELSEAEISAAIEKFSQAYPGSNVQTWLDELGINLNFWRGRIIQMLLTQKIIASQVYSKINISDSLLQDYYSANQSEFKIPELRSVYHLQVRSLDLAELVQKELKSGRDFKQLIDAYSVALDRYAQGYLGEISADFLADTYSKPIFALGAQQSYTKIIESAHGFHIFMVDKIIPPHLRTFDEAKAAVLKKLKDEKSDEDFKTWFDKLKKNSKIIINDKNLSVIDEI